MSLLDQDPQRIAADPRLSAFVTANAGSGKTKTLIDRTARLLLEGVKPAAILCVTYTKAAAAEMQTRLYDRLGRWSVMADTALREQLAELQGGAAGDFDDTDLSTARALFAHALETPGGLKIQTIHAFCESVLHQFPLEANIPAHFELLDPQMEGSLFAAARRDMISGAGGGDARLAEAFAMPRAGRGEAGERDQPDEILLAPLAPHLAMRQQVDARAHASNLRIARPVATSRAGASARS